MKYRVIEKMDGSFEVQQKLRFIYCWETISYEKSLLDCRIALNRLIKIENSRKIKRVINIKNLQVIE